MCSQAGPPRSAFPRSTGSGGLEIADTNANSSAFTGAIFGFGGVNHPNHKQFIDLVSVTSAAHTISFSYTSAAGSGTLTVSSGGAVVASVDLVGAYTSSSFHIVSGISGTVAITDPAVVNGGTVEPAPVPSVVQCMVSTCRTSASAAPVRSPMRRRPTPATR